MATMVFPICDLENSVRIEATKALAVTGAVVSQSKAAAADFKTVCQVVAGTVELRRRLSHLTRCQAELLRALQLRDFGQDTPEFMDDVAAKLDRIVVDERAVLHGVEQIGSEIRFFWRKSLSALRQQVEHMDSIAESLHISADPECSSLLGLAVSQIA